MATSDFESDFEKEILVVGGAGYIGSHVCKALARKGYRPITIDSLVCGHRESVRWGPLYVGSMSDAGLLEKIFNSHKISAVMHFAAFCYVGESVTDPGKYYRNNVAETLALLEEMVRAQVKRFIFSSSCATYGEPLEIPMTEEHPQAPINPYGRSKRMVEEILSDFRDPYGIESVCLRYFNAAGADPEGEIGEDHRPETHLIPLILQTALGKREAISVFGDDYPTADRTAIRDYIHVNDLAQAHLLALEQLLSGRGGGRYNLGNGQGHSVMEVIETARRVTKEKIPAKIEPRREGDPAVLIGSSGLAMTELGWRPQMADIHKIIETAWEWHRNHPEGYGT